MQRASARECIRLDRLLQCHPGSTPRVLQIALWASRIQTASSAASRCAALPLRLPPRTCRLKMSTDARTHLQTVMSRVAQVANELHDEVERSNSIMDVTNTKRQARLSDGTARASRLRTHLFLSDPTHMCPLKKRYLSGRRL